MLTTISAVFSATVGSKSSNWQQLNITAAAAVDAKHSSKHCRVGKVVNTMTITLISLHTAADYVYCSRRKNQIHHCHLRNLKLHPRPLARWFTVTWGSTFTLTSTTSKTESLVGKRIDTITPRSVCWTTNRPRAPSTSTPIRHKSIKWNSTWRCRTKTCRRKWSTGLEERTRP